MTLGFVPVVPKWTHFTTRSSFRGPNWIETLWGQSFPLLSQHGVYFLQLMPKKCCLTYQLIRCYDFLVHSGFILSWWQICWLTHERCLVGALTGPVRAPQVSSLLLGPCSSHGHHDSPWACWPWRTVRMLPDTTAPCHVTQAWVDLIWF